jgi:hypothetical protein
VEALLGLAQIRAAAPRADLRDGAEAVALAVRACALSGRQDGRALAVLDQAYAEAGRFAEAIQTVEEELAHAASTKQPTLAEQAAHRLELYRAGKPYRQ